MLKKTYLNKNIILITAPTDVEVAKAFLRPQEYYESPQYAYRFFTRNAYARWYRKKHGSFNYYGEYSGFNVPDWAMAEVELWTREHKKERELFGLIKEDLFEIQDDITDGDRTPSMYFIGAQEGEQEDIDHELAHAFYYLYPEFKANVLSLLGSCSGLGELYEHFGTMEYHVDSWVDEAQAYLTINLDYLKKCGFKSRKFTRIHKLLKKNFDHFKALHVEV